MCVMYLCTLYIVPGIQHGWSPVKETVSSPGQHHQLHTAWHSGNTTASKCTAETLYLLLTKWRHHRLKKRYMYSMSLYSDLSHGSSRYWNQVIHTKMNLGVKFRFVASFRIGGHCAQNQSVDTCMYYVWMCGENLVTGVYLVQALGED